MTPCAISRSGYPQYSQYANAHPAPKPESLYNPGREHRSVETRLFIAEDQRDRTVTRPFDGRNSFVERRADDAVDVAVAFLVVHIATSILDGFAPIGLLDAVVPLHSAYRPIWLGLGAVAFDLMLAVTITSLVKRRIGYRTWRAVHWLAYLSWPVAVVHSFGTGSDQVRVIFRTAGTRSPLERQELAPLREIWRRDDESSEIGYELDMSGVYGGFHCYVRR